MAFASIKTLATLNDGKEIASTNAELIPSAQTFGSAPFLSKNDTCAVVTNPLLMNVTSGVSSKSFTSLMSAPCDNRKDMISVSRLLNVVLSVKKV